MSEEQRIEALAAACAAIIDHPYLQNVQIERTLIGRRYSLRVAFNTQLCVYVPYLYSESEALSFVKKHRRYVCNRLRPQPVLPAYEEGDAVFLFGKEYIVARAGDTYRLEGERSIDCGSDVKKHILALLYRNAETFLHDYTRAVAADCGIACPKVTLSHAKSYWGCCRREREGVTVSYLRWACLLPERVLRYLVVHELCHIAYFNHSRSFWAAVQKALPDYKERNKLLDDYAVADFNARFGVRW